MLKPDLTRWDDDRCLLIGDCKCKRPLGGIPNADIFQMLAYLTEFGLCDGWLIYALGETRRRDLKLQKKWEDDSS